MIAFDQILDRMDNISLAPGYEPQRVEGLIFYSLKDLNITFTPRP